MTDDLQRTNTYNRLRNHVQHIFDTIDAASCRVYQAQCRPKTILSHTKTSSRISLGYIGWMAVLSPSSSMSMSSIVRMVRVKCLVFTDWNKFKLRWSKKGENWKNLNRKVEQLIHTIISWQHTKTVHTPLALHVDFFSLLKACCGRERAWHTWGLPRAWRQK